MLTLYYAQSKDGVFGILNPILKTQGIPWTSTLDMQLFRMNTMGHTLLMGRKTYQAMKDMRFPFSDKGRTHVVLSSTLEAPNNKNVKVIRDLDQYLGMSAYHGKSIMCIGGAQLLTAIAPRADKIMKTTINKDVGVTPGATMAPDIDFSTFALRSTAEMFESNGRESLTVRTYTPRVGG